MIDFFFYSISEPTSKEPRVPSSAWCAGGSPEVCFAPDRRSGAEEGPSPDPCLLPLAQLLHVSVLAVSGSSNPPTVPQEQRTTIDLIGSPATTQRLGLLDPASHLQVPLPQ